MIKSLNFNLWMTITLRTGLCTSEDYSKAIISEGCHIGVWGKNILRRCNFVDIPKTELDLVKIRVVELGFKEGAVLEDIYLRALRLGLELCPCELGPQLRLRYTDQPKDEWLMIGMKSIVNESGHHDLFHVVHGGAGLWLVGGSADLDTFWSADQYCVFVRPR